MKIAIVGAGIAGITAAYFLSKKGYNITVFEKERYAAMKCSYANGGQISVSNSEVWNTWPNIKKAIKWVGKKDAPLLLRPNLNWKKAFWLIKFLASTVKNDHELRTIETIKMGVASRRLYNTIRMQEKLDFDYKKCGIMHIYKNPEYFRHAVEMKDIYESYGCSWVIKTSNECLEIEPRLHHLHKSGLVGGIWTEEDSVGDIHKFCTQLEAVLAKKYKVDFRYNTEIKKIDALYDFDKIVIANGSDTCSLAMDHDVCVYPVKGYSITIEGARGSPSASILDDEAKIVCSRLGDRLRVAGTAEIGDHNLDITRSRITPLLKWVKDNFPQVTTAEYSQWACLRPMSHDMMPIVRQSSINPKIYYHTGHGHLGWTLAPATAKQLSELI